MKVKETFKIKEVREIEALLVDNADLNDDVKTAQVLTILCDTPVKPEDIPEMNEIDVIGLVSDYWVYKKKLNESIAQKLTGSTPVQS